MEWFDSLVQFFVDLLQKALDALWCMFQSALVFVYQLALQLLNWLSNLDIFTKVPFNIQTYVNLIPSEAQNAIGYIGLDNAFTIIISGYLIRLGLRAVPFVRGLFS